MTRRGIIAGVILLAAVVVAVPFAPGAWRAVAYRELRVMDTYTSHQSTSQHTLRGNSMGGMGIDLAMVPPFEPLRFHQKRYAWVGGRDFIIPDQACPTCRDAQHAFCFPRHMNSVRCWLPDGTRVDLPQDFRCTCTDPSHDGE